MKGQKQRQVGNWTGGLVSNTTTTNKACWAASGCALLSFKRYGMLELEGNFAISLIPVFQEEVQRAYSQAKPQDCSWQWALLHPIPLTTSPARPQGPKHSLKPCRDNTVQVLQTLCNYFQRQYLLNSSIIFLSSFFPLAFFHSFILLILSAFLPSFILSVLYFHLCFQCFLFFPSLLKVSNQPSPFMSSSSSDSINHGSKIFRKKITESSRKQNLTLLYSGNYLHSIYIVFTMIYI